MKRCFISINIPEDAKKEIQKIQVQLPEFYGKKTEFDNLHLTLKFLGEINDEKIKGVKERLEKVKYRGFETEVKYVGFLDNVKRGKRYGPVWLYLSNCEGLQKKIDESLEGLFEEERRFMSHLTIARVKSVKDRQDFLNKLGKIKIPEMKFNVKEFYLMESELNPEGPVYAKLAEYALK